MRVAHICSRPHNVALVVMMIPSGNNVPLLNVAIAIPAIIGVSDCTAPINADAEPASRVNGAKANAVTLGDTRAVVVKNRN